MAGTIEPIIEICRSLPEATVTGQGPHHHLTVKRKTFGWHAVDGRIALHCKAAKGANELLVAADPDRFFIPPNLAKEGFVGLWLDTEYVGWDEVRALLTDAYRLVAPKKLVARLDG